MPSLRVASLHLFLGYIFPQPDEAAKAIRLFSFHLKSHEPTSWSDRNISCLALILTRLHNSSLLGFLELPHSFSPEMCPSFQRRHGQFANILLLLRARRKQILQCPAQHDRHSALLSLCCIGCIFLVVALLIKGTWIWSKGHHPPCDPLPALASLGPKSHCREAKWVS